MTNLDASSMSDASDLYQRGSELMESGDYDAAIKCLEKSVHLDPHFKSFERLGECFMATGRMNEAILYLSAAAGLGNRASRSYFLLAKALAESGNTTAAIEKLDCALALNPDYRSAREFRKQLLK